jgi:signal transduction histidine kinase
MGGYARILQEDHSPELNGEARQLLDRIQENATRMGELIDGLLDLARVSRVQILREEVNLSEIAEEVVAAIQKRQPRPEAQVRIAPNLTARAEPRLMQNVLQNLIENAWKFTQEVPRPVIEFGCFTEGKRPVFYIRDNGVGFDPAFAGKLFGAFERLHNAADYPGTGIGLATVKRIIERHGGKVWAEGELGRGATFFFTVPDEPTEATPPEPQQGARLM